MRTLGQSRDSPMVMANCQEKSQRMIIINQRHFETFRYETGPTSGTLQKTYAMKPEDWFG